MFPSPRIPLATSDLRTLRIAFVQVHFPYYIFDHPASVHRCNSSFNRLNCCMLSASSNLKFEDDWKSRMRPRLRKRDRFFGRVTEKFHPALCIGGSHPVSSPLRLAVTYSFICNTFYHSKPPLRHCRYSTSPLPASQRSTMATPVSDGPKVDGPMSVGGRTMAHQDKLPHLPVPPLADTMKRYIKALEGLQVSKCPAKRWSLLFWEDRNFEGQKFDRLTRKWQLEGVDTASDSRQCWG